MHRQIFFPGVLLLGMLFPFSLFSCPLAAGLPDYNCNGRAKFSIIGDSVVQGFGDSINKNRGGYVARFARKFSEARVVNLGVYAITTGQLFRRHKRGEYLRDTVNSDVILLDAGRNDCRRGESTLHTVRDLKRLVNWLRRNNAAAHSTDTGSSAGLPEKQPFVLIATQIPHRDYRRACLESLNANLLRRKSNALPVYLRFDRLPAGILSSDGLHPSSSGYARMAQRLNRFAERRLLNLISRVRPDVNGNGIYDVFEGL